jgi:phosphate transport system permease protein
VRERLVEPPEVLTAVVEESPASGLLALVHGSGRVQIIGSDYRLTYPGGARRIVPSLVRPYGERRFDLGIGPLAALDFRDDESGMSMVGASADGRLAGYRLTRAEDFLTGEVIERESALSFPESRDSIVALHLGVDQRWLYQVNADGSYRVWDLASGSDTPSVADSGQLFDSGGRVATSGMLLGGISLLAGSRAGEIYQYFMARRDGAWYLARVRQFDSDGITLRHLLPEQRRKGFVAIGVKGEIQIYHSTAERRLISLPAEGGGIVRAALAPRADRLMTLHDNGEVAIWTIDNEHPDVSWPVLWSKVWYESYDEPEYIWQSSASSNDFEPKYSLSPLAFGTLKAAFYAMLVAAPMAVCGAIYTAYFMAPRLRRKIKPMIELMEALPTVILGFLAGLWLAPFVEGNLAGVFAFLLLLPPGVLLFALGWSLLPRAWRGRVPEGWHAALLVPVICLLGYACFASSQWLELLLFEGDMRSWLSNDLGVPFDQRNALVVGIAMGMAVIPTIFSISEDAIFSVPRNLSEGSLALGATPWQTLVGVVLPTASPGIFSALMIGMGRAVGETMIVLMATGNTPIMDANIFEGMRTLAANIAVEVPEAEVDSTHYRILFLTAFVLFAFTFVVNTVAELVRQRLRLKYGSL